MSETFDDRDAAILARRQQALNERPADIVHEGDWIRFACGTMRRASYVWRDHSGTPLAVQTSDGGSWYLGNSGHVSFSGSLYTSVKPHTITRTDETREANVWFFHHDWAGKDRGVHTTATFRVFACSAPAPTY